jgi:hypothetical protein
MSPELPLIFMTRYSSDPITTESCERRIASHRVIMKPFLPNVLLSTVREVLDSTVSRAHTAVTGPATTSSNYTGFQEPPIGLVRQKKQCRRWWQPTPRCDWG